MKGTVDYTHATAFVYPNFCNFYVGPSWGMFPFLVEWTIAAYYILYQVVANSDATRVWRYDHARDFC